MVKTMLLKRKKTKSKENEIVVWKFRWYLSTILIIKYIIS